MQSFELVNALSAVVSAVAAVVSAVVSVLTLSAQGSRSVDPQQGPDQDDMPPGENLSGWKRPALGGLCAAPC